MNFDKLKGLMEHFVDERYAPGNCISVCMNGEKIFEYSCGYADVESRTPMTGDELFNLYSCSKITTVTAALQLLEKGKFMLDDPLSGYMPEYKRMYIKHEDGNLVEAKNQIKIRHLLNMTAGLTYNMQSEAFDKARALTDGRMDTDVVARCLAGDPISFEPGEKFQYSLCHDVLAGLVSIVSGMKFRDYVSENIFKPLGMNDSYYHLKEEMRARFASQYSYKSGNGKDREEYLNVGIENKMIPGEEFDSGGAGIISTVSDYIKLLNTLANFGTSPDGVRILSQETVNLMRTNTLNKSQLAEFSQNQYTGYGYGLGVRTMMNPGADGVIGNVGEFGWCGAAGCMALVDPDIGLAMMYAKHMLKQNEPYYMPRLRNVLYSCL